MFSERIINLFANPDNVGILQSASGVGVYTDEKTNEVFKLYLKIENNYVVNSSFKVYSGVVGIALMSAFTQMLKNKSIENLSKLDAEDVLKEIEVNEEYEYLADDAIESLKLAVTDYQKKLEKEEETKKKAKKSKKTQE